MTLSDDGLRALFPTLRDNPDAQRRLRAVYRGGRDPLDVLRWRLQLDAADHPRHEIEQLQRVVHARPTPETPAAVRRIRELDLAADDAALDEAIARYLDPDAPPAFPRRAWFEHPVAWFGVGALVTLLGVGGWMLLPHALGGAPEPYQPFASSLNVFERAQTEAEALMGANSVDVDAASVRRLAQVGDYVVFAGLVGEGQGVAPWYRPGDVCLFVRLGADDQFATAGNCVPPEQFDRSGVWSGIPNGPPGEFTTIGWGPVGEHVYVIERGELGQD